MERRDRSEQFLVKRRIMLDYSRNHGRFQKIAGPGETFAAQPNLRAGFLGLADLIEQPVQRRFRRHRRLRIHRVAGPQRRQARGELVQEGRGALATDHDNPLGPDAALAVVEHPAEYRAVQSRCQRCIFQHDQRIAAAFPRRLFSMPGRRVRPRPRRRARCR